MFSIKSTWFILFALTILSMLVAVVETLAYGSFVEGHARFVFAFLLPSTVIALSLDPVFQQKVGSDTARIVFLIGLLNVVVSVVGILT